MTREHEYIRLVGKEVLTSHTGERLGKVADILIDADKGRILGLVVGSNGPEQDKWVVREFELEGKSLTAAEEAVSALSHFLIPPEAVSVVNEIIGAKVVTMHGALVGRVSGAGYSNEGSLAIFRISKSVFQKILGHSFLIKSNDPKFYLIDRSDHGARLIVPSDMPLVESKDLSISGEELVAAIPVEIKSHSLAISIIAILLTLIIIATLYFLNSAE